MKRLVIILSVVAVLLAGIATVVIISRARTASIAPPASDGTTPIGGAGTRPVTPGSPSSTSKPQGIVPPEKDAPPVTADAALRDTDADGLSDGEEAALRTDPSRKDTDADGLSDLEEVRTYCTDPLKTMTDGKTQDKAWVAAREQEAAAAGQRPSFCVE
ncbi:MAG: hypothetical protein QY323_02955 [Patescibacteria group bacterium]|nr:MAG: hypothetical protein QY323_02955 [Patescibacteria group bacterium]